MEKTKNVTIMWQLLGVTIDFTNSYNFLLDQSKLPLLKIRRMALETFKIVNKSSPEIYSKYYYN
jgi:hypothetical protein